MRKLLIIIFILTSNFIFSQKNEDKVNFRKVTGLISGYEIPKDGILVSYVGLKYAVITDSEGKFCLTIPKDKSIFIEVPICGALTIQEVKPTDNHVVFQVTSIKDKTKYQIESEYKWNTLKDKILPDLIKIYGSEEYKKANINNCW